ncbi:MAG: ABC transporter permease [Chloroflexi bacterium]|nr:ABC transporter permease [Chloroflexota bacterium]MYD48631.1 ABC transporter permease [Chloroflexota bacterium]
MATTNTGQGLTVADADAQLLEMRPRQTQLQKVVAFSRSKPLGAVSAVIILLTILAAVISYVVPGILPHDPLDPRAHEHKYMAPQPGAWLGSDHLGRDELSRLIVGSQISIYVGLLSVGIGVTLGALIGILSAYVGGVFDLAIQRLVDAMMAFPPIILALGLVAVLGGSANNVIIALLVILLPGTIRVIRSQVLSIKELDYTLAAQAIGAGSIRIMLRHILPNVVASYIVLGTITLGFAIIIEASLSFLGVGVPPDIPTWGGMLTRGTEEIRIAWWLAVFPGIAISVVVFAINFLGDALRDTLDPRLRGR